MRLTNRDKLGGLKEIQKSVVPHFIGAAAELTVARFYITQGFQVYFPVVQQGNVDLVVEKPSGLERVQVKTANLNSGNTNKKGVTYTYIQCRLTMQGRQYADDAYDTLCVVYGQRIWEIPKEKIWQSNICLGRIPDDGYKPQKTSFKEYEVTPEEVA